MADVKITATLKWGQEVKDTKYKTVTVFDVAITTPTSFPIYVAKGEEVSGGLDCTISPAGATGGTYL